MGAGLHRALTRANRSARLSGNRYIKGNELHVKGE